MGPSDEPEAPSSSSWWSLFFLLLPELASSVQRNVATTRLIRLFGVLMMTLFVVSLVSRYGIVPGYYRKEAKPPPSVRPLRRKLAMMPSTNQLTYSESIRGEEEPAEVLLGNDADNEVVPSNLLVVVVPMQGVSPKLIKKRSKRLPRRMVSFVLKTPLKVTVKSKELLWRACHSISMRLSRSWLSIGNDDDDNEEDDKRMDWCDLESME